MGAAPGDRLRLSNMAKGEKIHLTVRVQTKARAPGIEELGPRLLRVRVAALPVKGAANREVIKLIAAHFHLAPSRVEIIKGHRSKEKIIELKMD